MRFDRYCPSCTIAKSRKTGFIGMRFAWLVGGYNYGLTLVGVIWCMNNSLVGTSNTSNEWQMTLLVRSRSFDRRFARMSFEVIRSRPCLLRLSRPLSLSLSLYARSSACWHTRRNDMEWAIYVHTVTHQPHTVNGRQQYSTSRPPTPPHAACRSLI